MKNGLGCVDVIAHHGQDAVSERSISDILGVVLYVICARGGEPKFNKSEKQHKMKLYFQIGSEDWD
jgi:hypothetical protein